MPSRVLETVLTGRNLLSPVLTGAARDVEGFDAKVAAANARAGESSAASARTQETATAKVVAANARTAESSSAASAKVVAANVRSAESMRAFADVSESSAARAGLAWGSLATKALPLVAVATALVTGKMAGDYQQLITKLQTTAGESQRNLGAVSKGMLDMAGQVGISADELAKGMYTVDSAGIHGADSLTVLKAAAQGARQEQADLGHVVDAVTTSLHDYHLPASDAAKVTSELIAAVSHGKTTFDELTGAMHSIEPVAAGAQMTIAQTAGALAAMTASGMHADQAAQNLAHTIGSFENATKPMRDELFQLGLDATDLQTHLGERGIAGTLQLVSDAIVHKMGPAGQIALTALQTNKTAVQGLSTMIGAMPPQLADLATGLLAGTTGQKEFRTAAMDLGGTAGALADQFLAAYKSNDGFSASLKSGGPQVQTYIGALAKAVGTADGLRTALMLTGENAGTTNDAIAAVGRASADTKGDIAGWSEVQGNFNQKLAQAGAEAKSLAIEAGQHMLPVLTSAVGWIGSTGLPGIQHLAGGVGDAVHAFMGIPAPVRDAVLALIALKAITSTDMFAGVVASGRVLAVGFAHDMGNMVASARAGAGSITAAFAEAKAAQQALVAERFGMDVSMVSKATGDIRGLGAAAGAAAKGGLAAMKSAGSGLVNLLGGPMVVATAGAVLGIVAIKNAVDEHDAAVKKATQDVQRWDEAIALGGGGQTAVSAGMHLNGLRQQISDTKDKINELTGATQSADGAQRHFGAVGVAYSSGALQSQRDRLKDLNTELTKGKAAWDKQLAGMTPVEEATARLDIAEHDLQMALKNNPANSQAVTNAEIRLQQARQALTGETDRANAAEKTRIQRLQDSADAVLGLVDANRQAQEASLELTQQVSDYNKQIADGSLKGDALKSATLGIVDSAERAAKAAGDAAAQQAKQNGATDTGAASQAAFMKSLQDFDSTLTGPAKKSMDDYIAQLGGQQSQAQLTAGTIEGLGVTVTDLPDGHKIVIDVPTDKQMTDLANLGYATVHLPNGKIVVSADTNPAIGEIQDLLNYARQQSIQYRSDLPPLAGQENVSGGGRMGHAATGGWISGPGTGTSDSVPMWLSDGEFVVNAASAAQHADLLQTINSGMGRMAGGGWVNVPPGGWFAGQSNIPVSVDETQAKAVIAQVYKAAAATAFAPGAPTSVLGNAAIVQSMAAARGWTGAEWNALYALVMRESGFRNTAQNPTSTAYGMFQFLDSTWGGYGLGKTSDPRAQTRGGLDYIAGRYGDPLGAWGHETRYGWYDRGGPLQPGYTLAYNGTGKTEWVNTAEQQAASPASMPGYGTPFSGAQFGPTGPVNVTVQARVFVGTREITDIVRVEATGVVNGRLTDLYRKTRTR